MVIVDAIKRYAGQVVRPVLGTLIVVYIGYLALQGDRGAFAYISYSQELDRASATLADVRLARERLERQVASLRSEHLDPDLLEERARIVLDVIGEDECVILLPEGAAPK